MTQAATYPSAVKLTAAVTEFWAAHWEEHPQDEELRRAHWRNVQKLHEIVRADQHAKVDLARSNGEMEKVLYVCVVLDYFTPRPLETPGTVATPPLYSAEQAGLRVFHERGAWLATWIKLEEPPFQPESVRRQLLVIERGENGALCYRDLSAV
jgi:hypothetical protein